MAGRLVPVWSGLCEHRQCALDDWHSDVADVLLRRQCGADRSAAAGDGLSVDDHGLTVVDRDRIAVLVDVGASAAFAGARVVIDRVGGRRSDGEDGERTEERRCVLEAGQVRVVDSDIGSSSREWGSEVVERNTPVSENLS